LPAGGPSGLNQQNKDLKFLKFIFFMKVKIAFYIFYVILPIKNILTFSLELISLNFLKNNKII